MTVKVSMRYMLSSLHLIESFTYLFYLFAKIRQNFEISRWGEKIKSSEYF